jgi:hypothetical protein
MARHPAARLILDLGFAAAILVVAGIAMSDDTPAIPDGVCAGDGQPRYDAMIADDRIEIAALFGQIDERGDFATRSYHLLEAALVARGFSSVLPGRYERVDHGVTLAIDLTGPGALPMADPAATAAALTAALAGHDVVYYNGHEFDGRLDLATPATGYRILVLDSCWSTQRYSARLIGPTTDVIGNTERAVTGSVESFVALIDGLRDRVPSFGALLAPMNQLAEERARTRAMLSRWKQPERYRLDVACGW